MKPRLLLLLAGLSLTVHSQELENQLDGYVLAYVAQGKFSGAVLVAKEDTLLLNRGYSLANREWNIPNTPQTRFRLGSVTKQFTAAVIFKLQDAGLLDTADLVSKYVPDCPSAWEKVTIRHLLTHSSGIPSFTSFPDYADTMHAPSPAVTTLSRFRDKPLEFEPGSKFSYSNSGYVLLGFIIEKVSGKTFEVALREYVLDPLKLQDTGYDTPDKILEHRAAGYTENYEKNAAFIDMTIPHAAGAMYSTVGDLWTWSRAVSSDKLLSPAAWQSMLTPGHNNYACGLEVSLQGTHPRWAHGGGINGFATFIARYPDDKLTVVVLGNSESARSGEIAVGLSKLVFGESIEPPKTRVETKINPEIFDAYAGRYELKPEFVLTFWREGETFWTQATGQPKAQLYPESETRFFLKVVDAQVSFEKDADGKVTNAVLHQGGEHRARRLP